MIINLNETWSFPEVFLKPSIVSASLIPDWWFFQTLLFLPVPNVGSPSG